ncbi:MAG: hypothetical protein ABI634_12930 [Acidobacteriota bacterium]
MPLRASHFTVTRRSTGKLAGHAMLCPDARYATLRLFGETRLCRGFAHPAQWKTIEADLAIGWEKGHVPRASAVAKTLLGELDSEHALQFVTAIPFDVANGGAAAAFDAYLWQQAEHGL